MSARADIHRLFESGATSYPLDGYLDAYRAEVRRADAARLLDARREHASRAIFCDGIEHAAALLEQWANENGEPHTEAPADFFEPGHTYTVNEPYTAPEIRPHFRCVAVAIHPTTGNRRAFGFEQRTASAPWASASLRDEEWADGWVDITSTTKDGAA